MFEMQGMNMKIKESLIGLKDANIDHFFTIGEINNCFSDDDVKNAKRESLILPLKFNTIADEINFLFIRDLLSFGSSRYPGLCERMKKKDNASHRPFDDILLYGVLGMYLANSLDASFMLSVSVPGLSSIFNMPYEEDVALQPGIYKSEHIQPSYDFLNDIKDILQKTGAQLQALQANTFYDFLIGKYAFTSSLFPGVSDLYKNEELSQTSGLFIAKVIHFFPFAFQDEYQFSSEHSPILILNKAQQLAMNLHTRFNGEVKEVNFKDMDKLSVCIDDRVLETLIDKKVLIPSQDVLERAEAGKPLTKKMEACMRGTAILACEGLMKDTKLTPLVMDSLLKENAPTNRTFLAIPSLFF